jgi:hypothetical protein
MRRVKNGKNWHPATDNLDGTNPNYGVYNATDHEGNETFNKQMDLSSTTQYLFTSNNFDDWLLASKEAVMKTYNDEPADIMASHLQMSAYQANWKNQIGNGSDPEINF